MQRIDHAQFSKENKMLFRKGSWFMFLDLGDFSSFSGREFYPRVAHKCDPRKKVTGSLNRQACCLVMNEDGVCFDCGERIPEAFEGFYNLAKWGMRNDKT